MKTKKGAMDYSISTLVKGVVVAMVIVLVFMIIFKVDFNKYFGFLPEFPSYDKRTELPPISEQLFQNSIDKKCYLRGWINKNENGGVYELYSDGKELRNLFVRGDEIFVGSSEVGSIVENNGVKNFHLDENFIFDQTDWEDKNVRYYNEIDSSEVIDEVFLCSDYIDPNVEVPDVPDEPIPIVKNKCEGTGENAFEGKCKGECSVGEVSIGVMDCNGAWYDLTFGYECCVKSSVLVGNDNQEKAFNYLRNAFVNDGHPSEKSKMMAAAFVGNFMAESGQDLNVDARGDNEKAYGIAQWREDSKSGGRWDDAKKWATNNNVDIDTLEAQLGFVMFELRGKENRAYDIVSSKKTIRDMASAVDQYYERSSGEAREERITYAGQVYNNFKNNI